MKKFKRMMSLTLALVMCSALCTAAFASGAEVTPRRSTEYESAKTPIGDSGSSYTYTGYSSLYDDGGSMYRAGAWVQSDSGSVSGGYMAAQARLYSQSGSLLDDTDLVYNPSRDFFVVATTNNPKSSAGNPYSQGRYNCIIGRGTKSGNLERAGVAYSRSVQESPLPHLAKNLQDGQYPVNELGKTYGSALLEEVVGYEPELIAAVGTEEQDGYVKREDLQSPEISSPEEAVAYMENLPESRTIPLYNLQEEVIGEFRINNNVTKIPVGCTLEEAKALVAAGTIQG